MPIFEYCCNGCKKNFEILQTAGQPVSCPFCGSSDIIKQVSVFSARISSARAAKQPSCADYNPSCSAGQCSSCQYRDVE